MAGRKPFFFSASDNSDPRTNGRLYNLVSRFEGLRHTAAVTLNKPSASYSVVSPGKTAVNRRLVLRNRDSQAAIIPYLRTSGAPDLRTVEGMLKSILKPGMTPEQKSVAIWKFVVDWRYPYWDAYGDYQEHYPVKIFNVYGYGLCSSSAQCFTALCEAAGLKARIWGLSGRIVGESFYDDAWHLFDPDQQSYFRAPDRHVLSVEDLAKDPSAILNTERATHTGMSPEVQGRVTIPSPDVGYRLTAPIVIRGGKVRVGQARLGERRPTTLNLALRWQFPATPLCRRRKMPTGCVIYVRVPVPLSDDKLVALRQSNTP